MLGHELGVLAQAVAGAVDLDYHSMVEQAVQQRCAITASPNTSPQSAKPRLEVRITAPRS